MTSNIIQQVKMSVIQIKVYKVLGMPQDERILTKNPQTSPEIFLRFDVTILHTATKPQKRIVKCATDMLIFGSFLSLISDE